MWNQPLLALDSDNINRLREGARRRLPKALFEFFDRGSEDETALIAVRSAFDNLRIRPRVMVDVSGCNETITLFGTQMGGPLAVAPTGVGDLLWPNGEAALAKAAGAAGIPFTLSMSSTTSLEEISALKAGPFWFQMYLWDDRRHSQELVRRAQAAGASALLLTVDTAVSAKREYNARNGFGLPFRLSPRTAIDFACHPQWLLNVVMRYRRVGRTLVFANYPEALGGPLLEGPRRQVRPASASWDDVRWPRKIWDGPLLVKGILHADDARLAVECGVDGLVISNHGGRTLDSAVLPAQVLPGIADVVGGKAVILADGGVRRGSDVAKLLALGASAVLVGRAPLYGLASGGEAGALRSLELIRTELRRTMALAGIERIDGLNRDMLLSAQLSGAGEAWGGGGPI